MDKMPMKQEIPLSDLQKAFNRKFPFLKIVFYSRPHQRGKRALGSVLRPKQMSISKLHPGSTEVELLLNGNMRTGTFEQEIRKKTGLNVQVFRRSGQHWIETAATDDWTLDEENRKGEQSIMILPDNYYDENSFQDEPYFF